jgi:hypothetical protein
MEWLLDFYGCRSDEFEFQIGNAGQLERERKQRDGRQGKRRGPWLIKSTKPAKVKTNK